ncbi:MAG: hypothetical protein JOZ57_15800, partial [Abitibacteriaceae bacterium]|nr:hypothetical protein [Abditibacteriaceae bacterium]
EVMQHAEEMVDEMGQRVGEWATRFSKNVQRMAARAREEMEDMWAEAQSLRRGEHLETSHVDAQSLNSSTAQDEED